VDPSPRLKCKRVLVLVKNHDCRIDVRNSMKAHRNRDTRAASHKSQSLRRRRVTNQKSRETIERARGKSDEMVFPFIEVNGKNNITPKET
jgi:hypothetical protein